MTCFRRPKEIVCGCGAKVPVGSKGPVPWRCVDCIRQHKLARQRGETTPSRPAHLTADEEPFQGPDRPLGGFTEEEYFAWKARRVLELWEREPELSVDALAERFDMPTSTIYKVLGREGIRVTGSGRGGGRVFLPAGPPVP